MIRSYLQRNFLNTEFLVTSAVILFCLVLSIYFPIDKTSLFQLAIRMIFFLVVIPAIFIKIVLGKKLSSFGLNVQRKKAGIFWGISVIVFLSLFYYAAFNYSNLGKTVMIPKNIIGSFQMFLFYQLVIINITVFSQEFFFRGFLLSTLREKYGNWAIFIQWIVFVAAAFFSGSFYWQYFAGIIVAPINGFFATKTKSIVFPYLTTLLFIIILDSFVIYLINK